MKTIPAGKFKATCLALLDEIETKREPVVVTKNGRPVAQIVPLSVTDQDPIFGFYRGNLALHGDVLSPIYTDAENEQFVADSADQIMTVAK